MIEADIPVVRQEVVHLIREIDGRYNSNSLDDVEEFEAILEEHLENLDAALSEIEDDSEPDQDLEPDPGEGCSIEEQFRTAYAQYMFGGYSIPFLRHDLAHHLRSVLEEVQIGGMSPSGFRGAKDSRLIGLARELFEERQKQRQRIARLRLHPLTP